MRAVRAEEPTRRARPMKRETDKSRAPSDASGGGRGFVRHDLADAGAPSARRNARPAAAPSALSSINRRRHDRVDLDLPSLVTEIDEFGTPGNPWNARVVDLSRSGVGLRSRRMVHLGRKVFVQIFAPDGEERKLLFGLVRQSRYADGGGYAVGIEFHPMLTTSTIRAWVSSRRTRV